MNRTRKHAARFAVAGSVSTWILLGGGVAHADTAVDGVSFADDRGTLYAPVRALAAALEVPVRWDSGSGNVYLGEKQIPEEAQRTLVDGQHLVAVRALSQLDDGTSVQWDAATNSATVVHKGQTARISVGEKKVLVNLGEQRMRAYQGSLLVLDTPVSTGRSGHTTPSGNYTAGPLKTPMLISRAYNDAEMPYSVQIRGDYVIHGYTSVPDYPASHGCR